METIIIILAFIFGSESEVRKTCVNISKMVACEDWISFSHRIAKLKDPDERELAYMAHYVIDVTHWNGGMTWNEAIDHIIADIQYRAKRSCWAGDDEKLINHYKSLYI